MADESAASSQPVIKDEANKPSSVFASSSLDQFLTSDKDLNISYTIPVTDGVKYVSERTTGMPIPDQVINPLLISQFTDVTNRL